MVFRSSRFIVGAVLGIVIIVVILIQNTVKTHDRLTMTFGNNDLATLSPYLHLNDDTIDNEKISAPQTVDDHTYRYMTGTSVRWWFAPKRALKDIGSIETTLTFNNAVGNLALNTASQSTSTEYQLPLYVSNMENMDKHVMHSSVDSKKTLYVYSVPQISTPEKNETVESWLKRNNQNTSLITTDVLDAINWTSLVNSIDTDTTLTNINTDIYSNATFIIYTPKEFHLSLKKINQNISKVNDGVRVVVRTLSGVQVAETIIAEDGIKNGKREYTVQDFEWNTTLPMDGAYALYFEKNDDTSHPILTNITLNSPYIALVEGTIKTSSPIRTRIDNLRVPINMSFVEGVGQAAIHFDGAEPFDYSTQGNSLLIDHIYVPKIGEYTLAYNSQIELRDGLFFLGDAKIFSPTSLLSTAINPDIIITGIDLTRNSDSTITTRNTWPAKIVSDMVVDPTHKKVSFELSQIYNKQPRLFSIALNNYNQLWAGCGFSIFSQNEYPQNAFDDIFCSSISDIPNITKAIIPKHSSATSLSNSEYTRDLHKTLDGVNNTITTQRTFFPHLKGAHTFAAYAPEGLNLGVAITDLNLNAGDDTVNVSVFDDNGTYLGSHTIDDDGVISNNAIASSLETVYIDTQRSASGIYIIKIQPQIRGTSDLFLIDRITVNTNKFITLDYSSISVNEPMTLFTNIPSLRLIKINNNSKSTKGNDIILDAGMTTKKSILLNEQNYQADIPLLLNKGEHTFSLEKGKVDIKGLNSSFTSDGFFTFGPYALGTEHIIIDEDTWGKTRLYEFEMDFLK